METLFSVGNLLVLPLWALMVFVPSWHVTGRLVRSPLIVLGPAIIYIALVLPDVAALLPIVAQPDVLRVAGVLGTPRGATIAWMHFLAIDLFVGRWVYLDARQRGLSHWLLAPVLVLVLLLAPLGLTAYLGVRRFDRPGA